MNKRYVWLQPIAAFFFIAMFFLTGGASARIAANESGGLWQNAVDLGGGWKSLSWFGDFNTSASPWIYHEQLGWLYPNGTSTESIWFWDANANAFLWTSQSTYPDFYSPYDGSRLLYEEGSSNPGWFYNLSTNMWVPDSEIATTRSLGGWVVFHFTISDEEKAVFNTAVKSLAGVSYVPVAVDSQLVAGTNYCFLCRGKIVNQGASDFAVKVYIYQPLQGAPYVTRVENLQP